MKSSKNSEHIFLKEGTYFLINDDKVFAKSSSIDDIYSAEYILIKYDWNLEIISENVINYKSDFFRVFTVEDNLLKLVDKFNKDSILKDNPKSDYVFLSHDTYFLIYEARIIGVFNSLNHAFIAENLLKNNSWDLNKLCKEMYFVLDYWVIIDIVDGILTFLHVSVFKENPFSFLKSRKLKNTNDINKKLTKKKSEKKSLNSDDNNIFTNGLVEKSKNKNLNHYSTLNLILKVQKGNSNSKDEFSFKTFKNLNKIDEFIYEGKDIFVITKSKILYGISDNCEGALLIKYLLDEINWDINRLGDLKHINYKEGYYSVIDISEGYIHFIDFYTNYDDAFECFDSFVFEKKSLINNNSKVSKSSNTSKKKRSVVTIKKSYDDFHLIREFKGKMKLFGIFSCMEHAKIAESILRKNYWNLDRIGGENSIFFADDSYWVVEVSNDLLNICSNFDTYDEAYNFQNGITDEGSELTEEGQFPIKMKSNELIRVDKYVFKKDDYFLIIRSDILFGVSYSKEGINVLKYILNDINWDYDYIKSIENIFYSDGYYWVMDISKGYILCVDFFKDYDSAFDCFESKNFEKNIHVNNDYENILISKIQGQFHLTAKINGKKSLFGIFPFKKYAEIAKLILEKNNCNLELISKEYIYFEEDSYWVVDVIDGLLNIGGRFNSYDDAYEYHKGIHYDLDGLYVVNNINFNKTKNNAISKIKSYQKSINNKKPQLNDSNKLYRKKTNPSMRKVNEYIYEIDGIYHIFNMIDGEFIHFGEFKSLNAANKKLKKLISINWYKN